MIDKFVYVHILKCAGTTIRHTFFERHFKNKYLYDSTFKPKNNNITEAAHPVIVDPQPYPKNYKKYNILFGHFKHDKYKHLELPMFSFVRNPVKRVINQYYYHKGFYKRNFGMNLSIIEFAEMWKNHMTYVLGDIDQYTYIGVVENLEKSLGRMCDIVGVPQPKNIPKKRMFGEGKSVDKKTRKIIAKINSEDMELYENIITWSEDISKKKKSNIKNQFQKGDIILGMKMFDKREFDNSSSASIFKGLGL